MSRALLIELAIVLGVLRVFGWLTLAALLLVLC